MRLLHKFNIYITKNIHNKSLFKHIIVLVTPQKLRDSLRKASSELNYFESVISFSNLNKNIYNQKT